MNARRRLRGLLLALVGLAAMATLAGLVDPGAALRIDLAGGLAPPGPSHLLGTDKLGRDVAARVLAGARLSLAVAAAAVAGAAAIGTAVGVVAGWKRGVVDAVAMRLVDVMLAFPGMLLAIALAGLLGPGAGNVVLALVVTGWTPYARVARAETRRLAALDHVEAARALGASSPRIVLRHVLPLVLAPLAVQAAFGAAGAVVAEAGLSFLGLGVPPPVPSWGSMLAEARHFVVEAPHLVVAPGAAITLLVLVLQLAGDALRDALDPRG